VLQDGELIGLIARVIQHPLHQARRNLSPAQRAFDGVFALLSCEARNQVLALVQGFGKVAKFGAVAQIV
jgi:hypothetical protein